MGTKNERNTSGVYRAEALRLIQSRRIWILCGILWLYLMIQGTEIYREVGADREIIRGFWQQTVIQILRKKETVVLVASVSGIAHAASCMYEYLRIQGIRIQGADLAPMDIGKALDPQEEQEEEKKPVILEAEDEQCLKEYEEMLRQFPSEKEGEREALLLQAVTDVAGVQERLAQLYLKEILQYARKLWRQGIYIGDLIQEGNMSLLLALAEEIPEEGKADWMEERLLAGMESWVKEQTEQKYRDESMVEKVRKLEAAIRELSDDEEQKFSVEELAAYLDMDEEEIRAVLRLTSEGADEEK